ncbi:hypothetical protein RGF97_00120 [Streptomyces roseicoloratus]|uniref:Glycoside hydrolase family 3 C-terminal domain-containing protein n=1 Tax=Streptomyces roseicoloratus TaxID=2508722 RepID=A0ABY9S3U5_9ACTN|nr:hypothetical protein [Streptomyces roseicoloratus]WMX49132.1 hypothetical protein RGF97_00120 [Streptomyces roseicoloratus]
MVTLMQAGEAITDGGVVVLVIGGNPFDGLGSVVPTWSPMGLAAFVNTSSALSAWR